MQQTISLLGNTLFHPDDPQIKDYLEACGYDTSEHRGISGRDLVKRPKIKTEDLMRVLDEDEDPELYEKCDIEIKYEGYIQKARREADKLKGLETIPLGMDFNYDEVDNLSLEGRQKLMKYRPETLGQASRISGVNPADIAVLSIAIRQGKGRPA